MIYYLVVLHSVTGYSDLKNARKVALASFYATAIQALIVTMGLEQYCVTLTDDMIDIFCADAFCLFNSLVARRLTFLLPKSKNSAIQGLRDKLVMDLKPSFRYIDNEKKERIRVVSPTNGFVIGSCYFG